MGACAFCNSSSSGPLYFGAPGADLPFDWKLLPATKTDIKVLFVGDSQVGKSALMQSYLKNSFVSTPVQAAPFDVEKEFGENKKVQLKAEELSAADGEKDNRQKKYADKEVHAIVICVAVN